MGEDPLTGKNFDHRKVWVENELKRLAACMGIDLLCHAILSNHFHLVLRSRPDVVETWDDSEVARRWLMLCPKRRDPDRQAAMANEAELNAIRNDPAKVEAIRSRLSDISWWMRLLSQTIAQRSNRDDEEVGKFFQARYRAVRLLDETAILACAAYVDLNPIRAAMAETLESSNFTSVQKRIASLQLAVGNSAEQGRHGVESTATEIEQTASCRDSFLAPLEIDEARDPIGPRCSESPRRASDKGFLPMPVAAYIELLDWTARQIRSDKRGSTPVSAAPIFKRLGISSEVWCELVKDFGRLFYAVAGKPHEIDLKRSRSGRKRYKTRQKARELLAG